MPNVFRIKMQNQMLADCLPTSYLQDGTLRKMIRLANAMDNAFNKPLRTLDFGMEDIQRMKEMRNVKNPLQRYVTHKIGKGEFSEIDLKDATIPEVSKGDVRAFMTGVQGLKLAPFYIEHSRDLISYEISNKTSNLYRVTGN